MFKAPTSPVGLAGYTFLYSAWQFNYLINHFLFQNVWRLGHLITYRAFDKGIIELIGPQEISKFVVRLTQGLSKIQSGQITAYALSVFVAMVLLS